MCSRVFDLDSHLLIADQFVGRFDDHFLSLSSFKAFVAVISLWLDVYLLCCFLFSTDLRKLENYPLFMLSLIDLLVTGPGFLGQFITRQFIILSEVKSPLLFAYAVPVYSKMRLFLQALIGDYVAKNLNPFWYQCVPSLFMIRLSEYGFGICSVVIAYERYILVVKAAEKDSILTSRKRKLIYSISTLIILGSFAADAIYAKTMNYIKCWFGFRVNTSSHMIRIPNLCITFVYAVIPALSCVYFYKEIAAILLARKHKVGRNLNLVLCFGTICGLWIFCLIFKTIIISYIWAVSATVSFLDRQKYPFVLNNSSADLVRQLGSLTSLFDPFLILVSQKDYRKPFLAKMELLNNKIKTLFKRLTLLNAPTHAEIPPK